MTIVAQNIDLLQSNLKEIIYFNNQKELILIKEKNNNQKCQNETLEK